MEAAFKTHIGCVRAFNEDTGAVVRLENGYLAAVVADGMGGHQAGDVASRMAVDIIRMELLTAKDPMTPDDAMDLLDRAILKANDAIYNYAKSHDDCHGMGTTVAACLINREWIVIGHIGDSRIYRINGEGITRLTEDHSLVNELLKNGQITKEEADQHPQRNILVRAVGTDFHVDVELRALEWEQGDKLLICSDGLSNKVSSQAIYEAINGAGSPQQAVDILLDLALKAGGEDNITAIVIADQQSPAEGNEVGR